MDEAERRRTAALVAVATIDPAHHHATYCLGQYFAELDRRFDAGFDPARSLTADAEVFRPPAGAFVVATLRGEPIGCGAVRLYGEGEPAYLKRMWVAPEARGLGVGRRLLAELEAIGVANGASVAQLETNRALTEAIAMYRSSGYVEVAPFNDEVYGDHWFEKPLEPSSRSGKARATKRERAASNGPPIASTNT